MSDLIFALVAISEVEVVAELRAAHRKLNNVLFRDVGLQ